MKTKVLFPMILFSAFCAAMFGIMACGGGGNGGTDGGNEECTGDKPYKCDGKCQECCEDTQCAAGSEFCDKSDVDFYCSNKCAATNDSCASKKCCSGAVCDLFAATCVDPCTDKAGCVASHSSVPFSSDMDCLPGGQCDFNHCSIPGDCAPPTVCFNGDCVTKPGCSDLQKCEVLPALVITKSGVKIPVAATAYLKSGALAPGYKFSWTSNDTNIATVGSAVSAIGEITGGANDGNTTVDAKVDGCPEIKCTADVQNYGTVAGGTTRVIVANELTNEPVSGAAVIIEGNSQTTNAQGIATFNIDLSISAKDVTVVKADYNYVTVAAANSNDLIIYVGKLHHLANNGGDTYKKVAGGIKGAIDASLMQCKSPNESCEVLLGLIGLSMPGSLVNLNSEQVIGGLIKTTIEFSGAPYEVPLPAGIQICIQDKCFKGPANKGFPLYSPTGVPGRRVIWGLGVKVDFAKVFELLTPIIQGGENIDVGTLLASILPILQNGDTVVVPDQLIENRDEVTDVDDLNNNDRTDDVVPDYKNFPTKNVAPKVPMDKTITINLPSLEKVGSDYPYDAVLVIGGVVVRGAGLVPLGISAALDSKTKDDLPDGKFDPMELKLSDVAGRIPEDQVTRMAVVVAINTKVIAAIAKGDYSTPFSLSGQVLALPDFSTKSYTLKPWLLPSTAQFNYNAKTLVITTIDKQDYGQLICSGWEGAGWHFYSPNWDDGVTYTMPTLANPPTINGSAWDRLVGGCMLANMDLKEGYDYQKMIKFGEKGMSALTEMAERFCLTVAVYNAN